MIIKKWNSTTTQWDEQYPKTTLGQLYDDDTTTTFLNAGKIRDTYLPNSIFSGMKNVGTISGNTYLYELISGGLNVSTALNDITGKTGAANEYDGEWEKYIGHYWIATATLTITSDQGGQTGLAYFDDGLEEDTNNNTIQVEKGDWILISGYVVADDAFKFNIVNNTYANASTTQKGVVELATDAEVTTGTATNLIPSVKQLKDSYALKSHTHTDSQVTVGEAYTNIGSSALDPLTDVLNAIDGVFSTQATSIATNTTNIATNASDISTLEARTTVFVDTNQPTANQNNDIWFDI